MNHHLTVVHIAAECAPYSKSGGLGDVVGQLPRALTKLGSRAAVVIPFYRFMEHQSLGLVDVIDNLPVAIGKKNYSAYVKTMTTVDGTPLFFIGNDELFGDRPKLYGFEDDGLRFLFFNLAALEFFNSMVEERKFIFAKGVDVLHCHDWHSALVPQILSLNHRFPHLEKTATVFTIHNLVFQGPTDWWMVPEKYIDNGRKDPRKCTAVQKYLNFTKRGIMYADVVNTVSERYAAEIMTPQFGQGMDRLLRSKRDKVFGIINGIDYSVFNPQFDHNIYTKYDADSLVGKIENKIKFQEEVGLETKPDIPIIGMVNRLTEQKGFRLMMQIMPVLLKLRLQLIVVGTGDKEYLDFFRTMAKKHPKQVAVYSPFSEVMASKVYAASDMYLMPSRFEPCGLSQLISLRYGSVPIVHETGGLHDTITNFNPSTDHGNGFAFSSYTKEDLLIAVVRALETYQYPSVWQRLVARGMKESFSWKLPAKKYAQLYHIAIRKARGEKGAGFLKPAQLIRRLFVASKAS